jgi:hypothetical protein
VFKKPENDRRSYLIQEGVEKGKTGSELYLFQAEFFEMRKQ